MTKLLVTRQRLIRLAILTLLLGGGCERSVKPPITVSQSSTQIPPIKAVEPAKSAVAVSGAEFRQIVTADGSVNFRSWNGKWIGTDCDTDLEFKPGGAVILTEYRYAVDKYRGTYSVDAKGMVTTQFPTHKSPWLIMLLMRDSTSLLIQPASGQRGFSIGDGAGATISSGQGSYWPFRPFSEDGDGK